ncbi:MAG TPA: zinc ribbon domain-containing protein [Thermoleophilaceae bacterium]|nr:zinc ribbon domain-containing protein [Thermoleophilaceae bacterium]
MDQAAASPSCPRCGAECPAGAAHCPACGFALIDGGERRPSGGAERWPSGGGSGLPWVVALAAAVAAVAAVFVMLFAGGGKGFPAAGPARTGPPAAVPALEAERRLELRFGGESDDETAAVRCPYRIEPRQMVRCELRYADGIARAMLVRLTPSGELEAAIPYPATLRRSSQSHGD